MCWHRVSAALKGEGTKALLTVFYDIVNFPRDPKDLYNYFDSKQRNPEYRRFRPNQMKKLLPSSGETNTKIFDIPMLVDLIIIKATKDRIIPDNRLVLPDGYAEEVLCGTAPFPPTFPVPPTLIDMVRWLKNPRNQLLHHGIEPMSDELCDIFWEILQFILDSIDKEITMYKRGDDDNGGDEDSSGGSGSGNGGGGSSGSDGSGDGGGGNGGWSFNKKSLDEYRYGDHFRNPPNRQASLFVFIEYLKFETSNSRYQDTRELLSKKNLTILFFEFITELSIREMEYHKIDLSAIHKNLFKVETDALPELPSKYLYNHSALRELI